MRVTVLGTSGAWPAAGRACSGYLLESGDARLVLDLGFGVLPRLLERCPAAQLTAVFLSHAHADHCVDLYGLFRALRLSTPPLPSPPIFASEEVVQRVGGLDGPGGPDRLRRELDLRPLPGGDPLEVGPFRLRAFELPHFVPNHGVRVEAKGRVVAYTGDTGPSDRVLDLARDADLFLCEATFQTPPPEQGPRYLLSATEAGEYARAAGVRQLMLTHFWPGEDRSRSRVLAAAAYGGPVSIAEEGLTVDVG